MRQRNLAIFILQDVGIRALQDARRSSAEAHRMIAQRRAAAASLDSDEANLRVGKKFIKRANGIRSAAHAGDDGGGQPAFLHQNLLLHLDADAADRKSTRL